MKYPSPDTTYPLKGNETLCFLKNIIKNPNSEKRFSVEKTTQLLKMEWWDWPVEKLSKSVQYLTGNDLAPFRN